MKLESFEKLIDIADEIRIDGFPYSLNYKFINESDSEIHFRYLGESDIPYQKVKIYYEDVLNSTPWLEGTRLLMGGHIFCFIKHKKIKVDKF